MTTITIAGEFTTLLTHCALWGTATILANDLGPSRVRAGWQDADDQDVLVNPRAVIEVSGAGAEEVGAIVRGLALMVSSSEHWAAQAEWRDNKPHSVSVLTPRTGIPDDKELTSDSATWWKNLEGVRAEEVSKLTALEQDMVRGLGARSWWLSKDKKLRHDLGASPWEMKTRNRGEEFLSNRFLPLAEEIATWEPGEIVSGLEGRTLKDTVGKNKLDSRTATGLASPGPCDNAMAWCALWAMTALQPIHSIQRVAPGGRGLLPPAPSSFSGRVRGKNMPSKMETLLVAVPNGLVSPAAWARLQRSRAIVNASERLDVDIVEVEKARAQLRAQGVSQVVAFPVSRSDNPSAPERRALAGEVVLG